MTSLYALEPLIAPWASRSFLSSLSLKELQTSFPDAVTKIFLARKARRTSVKTWQWSRKLTIFHAPLLDLPKSNHYPMLEWWWWLLWGMCSSVGFEQNTNKQHQLSTCGHAMGKLTLQSVPTVPAGVGGILVCSKTRLQVPDPRVRALISTILSEEG